MSQLDTFSGLRILVVEDEYLIAAMLSGMLDELGCQTIGPCGRVDEALHMASFEELDGALLDRNLHGQDVYPVAEALRGRDIPFSFISGYDDSHMPAEWLSHAKIVKPFQYRDVEQCVAAFALRSRARR